jgi:hypothetical protein
LRLTKSDGFHLWGMHGFCKPGLGEERRAQYGFHLWGMHVVALRQFCILLAQKSYMAAMQIQAMFGTYDPAEYQWPPARSPWVIFVGCITNKHVHELADNSAAAQHDHLMAHHVSDVCVYVSLGHGLSAVTGIASP